MDNEPTDMIYLINCRDCDDQCSRPLTIPFESAAARGKWASEHTAGTGHSRWLVRDEPRRNKPVTVEQIRAAVEAHQPEHGYTSWYVDEHVIDCDADEFWTVIAAVLQKA